MRTPLLLIGIVAAAFRSWIQRPSEIFQNWYDFHRILNAQDKDGGHGTKAVS